MRIRLALILSLLTLLACKTVTSSWTVPPSATPTPEPPTLTSTLTPTRTATLQAPTATPTLRKPTPTEVVPTSTLTPTPGTREVRLSTSGQLQVFEALWNIVNKEYLYPDFNGLDWASLHAELHKKIQAGMSTEDFYRGMYELIRSLGDDHSTFFSPKQAESEAEQFKGSYDYTGIGIFHVLIPERNLVSIVAVFPGSPAEQAGLHIHDNVLEVNGKPILDANNLRTGDILGPPGTSLTLTVQTAGGQPRQIELEREKITAELPLPNWTLQSPQGKRIGYILLPTFNDETIGEQFKSVLKAMESEQKLDGLILDNRVNSGGADRVAYNVLSNFTKGTVGAFVGRNKEKPVRIVGERSAGIPEDPAGCSGRRPNGELWGDFFRNSAGRSTRLRHR